MVAILAESMPLLQIAAVGSTEDSAADSAALLIIGAVHDIHRWIR
jgi:hypothetical protein